MSIHETAAHGEPVTPRDLLTAALAENVTVADIERLIAIGQDVLAGNANAAKTAKEALFDPMTGDEETAQLKAELEALELSSSRMVAALSQLQARLIEIQKAEADSALLAAYQAAEATGRAIAKDLAETYPKAAKAIADILGRIDAHEKTVLEVNRTLPQGKPALVLPEVAVRGMTGIEQGYANLRNSVRLASLDAAEERQGRSIWSIVSPGRAW